MIYPSRLVQRFFPAVFIAILFLFAAVYFYSVPLIKDKVFEIERNSSRVILDNVATLAHRMYQDVEGYKLQALASHKKQLKSIVTMAESYSQSVYSKVRNGEITEKQGRDQIYEVLRQMKSDHGDYIWVSSYDYRLVSHPDTRFHDFDASDFRNSDGLLILPRVVDMAVDHGEGFFQYKWNRLEGEGQIDKISYVKNLPEWDFVIGSGIYLDDVEAEIKRKREKALKELRRSLNEVRIAKTGYLYVFDANNNMLIHPNPNIDGEQFHHLMNPVSNRPIYEDLVKVANTGKELYYKWDKPSDPGNYVYEKLSLVRHLEGFDWYIGSSVYVEELKKSSEILTERILIMSMIALLLAVIMVFSFIYWITNPIKKLADTALKVSNGDLTAVSGLRRDDELGILAKTFDQMVTHVRENIQTLDQKVQSRTADLEHSNQQLLLEVESREKAQHALEAIEQQQRIILELLPAQIAYLDPGLYHQFVNQHYANAVGHNKDHITGRNFSAVRTPFLNDLNPVVDRALRGEKGDLELMSNDRIIRYLVSPCFVAPSEEVEGVLLIAYDVTDEKEIERKLLEAQRMSAVGQLAGGLAHDFNNLLSIILGNLLSAADRCDQGDPLQEYLNPSVRAAKRGAEITNRLLAFARRQPLSPLACDVSGLIQESIELLRGSLHSDIQLVYSAGQYQLLPFVDPGRLEDALVNLVLNAREAMPDGGKIEFIVNEQPDIVRNHYDETVQSGNYIEITIRDSGSGFTEEALKRAFEPFFTTQSGSSGSGLGLSMVYGFVKQSDGYIRIENSQEGAAISLLLPAVKLEEEQVSQNLSEEENQHELPELSGKLVLLVDDEEDVRRVVRQQLIDLGLNVIESSSATEATELMDIVEEFDLLVSDIRLQNKEVNGFDIADRFKSKNIESGVLLMTGYAYEESLGRARDLDYLIIQKPFDIKLLKSEIINLFKSREDHD